jgi:nitroreductase
MTAPFDLRETDRLLSTTRAVRRRLDFTRDVPDDVILECVALAQQAPTASNTQKWRFVVVRDGGKRAALAELYRSVATAALPQARTRFAPDDRQTARVYDSAEWLAEHMHEAPVLVIPCLAERLPDGAHPGMLAAFYGSIFPAMWSFQLALRSRGLGSALTTLHLFRERDAATLLGIPDHATQVALLPVAWTRGVDFKSATRPPARSIVGFDHWPAESDGSAGHRLLA